MVVSRWTKTFALGGTYMIPPWPTHARERLFRDNCFSYTRELRLLMNIFYIKRNTVDTGRTSIMHLNWPWIGVMCNAWFHICPLTGEIINVDVTLDPASAVNVNEQGTMTFVISA